MTKEQMKDNSAFKNVLALTITFGFFTIVGIMLFHEIPQGSKDMLGPLIGGVIGASLSTIVQYTWGSSSGSAAHAASKDALMEKITGTGTGDGTGTTTTTTKTDSTKTVSSETPTVGTGG